MMTLHRIGVGERCSAPRRRPRGTPPPSLPLKGGGAGCTQPEVITLTRPSIRTGISVNPCRNGLASRVGLSCGTIFQSRVTTKLLGDAKRTPLTSIRGDADQWLVGAGLAFTF